MPPPTTSPRSEAMLTAAAKLFAARGFYGVTVDDIGAAVGLSGPALYHHFSSKEALLGEMLIGVSEELLAAGEKTKGVDPVDALRELVTGQIRFALEQPELITVHHRDLVHAPEPIQRRVRRLQSEYVEYWVDALCALGVEDQRHGRAGVHAVIGLINSTPFSMRIRSDEMSRLLSKMALAALSSMIDDPGATARLRAALPPS